MEPGQSKPGSADVYVEGCPQATSWFYNFDGDPTCARLSAISTYAVSEGVDGVLTNYDPKFAHALAADESEDISRETLVANIKYDFGAFDANLIISDRTVTDDSVTDWARIDMDDYVPAPLIVDGDKYYEETTELRFISKPGKFEWTVGYYHYEFNEEPNSVSQTQYAVDQSWLEYVMLYAAGLNPGEYDATIYCPPFCEGHMGYPYFYYGSYTEYNEQEENSFYGQFDFNVSEKLTLTFGIRDYEIEDRSKTFQYGIFFMDSTGCVGNDPAGTDCAILAGSESDTRMKYCLLYTSPSPRDRG